MSYIVIYSFDKKGNAHEYATIQNSWTGSMAIWGCLEEKYLPPHRPSYVPAFVPDDEVEAFCKYKPSRCVDLMNEAGVQEIWDLADNPNVTQNDKIVLCTTFDKCLVKKEHLQNVINAFNSFDGKTSLPEQARALESLLNNEDCIAVSWMQNSISCTPWDQYNYSDEDEANYPYNCLQQKEHFWLSDEVREIC